MKKIPKKLLDELLAGGRSPEEILGKDGLVQQFTKAIIERAMEAELTDHIGYEKHDPKGHGSGNSRNGHSPKTVKGEHGEVPIDVPRDRNGTFEPQIIPKGQTRFEGFDDKIIALYARGMSTRDIKAQLEEMYGVEVSPTLISTVTNAVMDEVKTWQNRPLDPLYPIVYLDAIRVKGRSNANQVENLAVYLAIGINTSGRKEVLGMWIARTEGAKFWLNVLTELKSRGLQDIFIASVDGLKGFPEAIESIYPDTQVQLCMVHMVRNSLKYVSWKLRKEMADDLKTIYQAPTREMAEAALEDFAEKWDATHPTVSRSWRANWERIVPMFGYSAEIRRAIYTTNAIESLNSYLRKSTRTRGSFPNDEAVMKAVYLSLMHATRRWTMPIKHCLPAAGRERCNERWTP